MPLLPQPVVDFSAGFGDTLSFNLTSWIREQAGIDGGVDKCSTEYDAGEWSAIGLSLTFGVAHLGRNAAYNGGRHMVWDGRSWGHIRDTWSRAAGGGQRWLAANGQSLHHWLVPRRFADVHAGFNYLPIAAGFNSWMNGSTAFRTAVEWEVRASILGIYGAPGTAALNACECRRRS